MGKTYYYETTYKDRIGNRFNKFYVTSEFDSKSAIINKYKIYSGTRVVRVWNEEQVPEYVKQKAERR